MPLAASAPAWAPQEPGVQQICYLLSEYQKPGTNQSQVLHWFHEATVTSQLLQHLAHYLKKEYCFVHSPWVLFTVALVVCLQILAQLEECKNIPDFNNYLAFILSQGDSLPVEVSDHSYTTQ